MKLDCTKKTKNGITIMATILLAIHLTWDYFHKGIPTHYILHDGDLPGFSNLWGLLVLPIVTGILVGRICRRQRHVTKENKQHSFKVIVIRFLSALLFGVLLSIMYLTYPDNTAYMMLGLFVLALFMKLYWSEYYFGFIIGTAFTFGVIIPTIAGAILILLYAILYMVPRKILSILNDKIKV